MFTSFALLLPFCASMLGLLVFLFKRYKHVCQQLMLVINVLFIIFFCADSLLIHGTSSWTLAVTCSALRQFIGPMLLPVFLLFVRSFIKSNYHSWTTGFWFIFPVVLGSVNVVLYSLMGMENAAAYISQSYLEDGFEGIFATDSIYKLQYVFEREVYGGVMVLEMLYVIFYLFRLMYSSGYKLPVIAKLLRTGGKVPVVNLLVPVLILLILLVGIRIGVGRAFLIQHKPLAGALNFFVSLVVLALNYFTLYANRSPVNLRTLRSPLSGADGAKKYHYETDGEKQVAPVEGMNPIAYAELVDSFKALIMVEKVYLEATLTVEDVATRLHSNRTYVSCMISKEYGMNFRDYLSSLRVDYSQKFMKANPSATQEEVAQASGFSSASTFNKKFHQVMGISPRQWQVNN